MALNLLYGGQAHLFWLLEGHGHKEGPPHLVVKDLRLIKNHDLLDIVWVHLHFRLLLRRVEGALLLGFVGLGEAVGGVEDLVGVRDEGLLAVLRALLGPAPLLLFGEVEGGGEGEHGVGGVVEVLFGGVVGVLRAPEGRLHLGPLLLRVREEVVRAHHGVGAAQLRVELVVGVLAWVGHQHGTLLVPLRGQVPDEVRRAREQQRVALLRLLLQLVLRVQLRLRPLPLLLRRTLARGLHSRHLLLHRPEQLLLPHRLPRRLQLLQALHRVRRLRVRPQLVLD